MTAKFPSDARSFTPKVDLVDTVYADHVNALQEEVRALETSLGFTTLSSSYSGTFSQVFTWTTLSDRLANIEAGLVNGVAGSVYLKPGDTVQAPIGSVGLSLRTLSGNTSDLIVTKNSSGTNGFRVDYLGIPYVNSSAVLYEGGSAYNTLLAQVSTGIAVVSATVNPMILMGI